MRSIVPLLLVSSLSALVACGNKQPPGGRDPGKPVETRPPNAPDQKPAFPGQTRAPFMTASVTFDVKVIAKGLDHPWSVALLPDGAFLVTERPGRLQIIARDGGKTQVSGAPDVDSRNQGGLLEVALDPEFATSQNVFLTYAEPRQGGNGTAVARARLVREPSPRLEGLQVIWRMTPTLESTLHFGSRIVFAAGGAMFVTTGERSILPGRKQAQLLDSAFGKVIRIQRDGQPLADNPFVGRQGALPEIWSYGHRNIQSAALHPETGQLWTVEHGARGGDEVNVPERGKDYGWPTITYGIEYSGEKIGGGITQAPGMEQPIYYWDPVIAPSGMAFYTGDRFPAWRGSLLVGALAGQHVARLTLDGTKIIGEERLVEGRARIRDVRVGPDGAVYLLTDEDDGELLELVPAAAK
jgi:aldose sugar dehydrogenase